MNAYNGINRHVTGIHRPLTRSHVADVLRSTRKINRLDALQWRNWLIYLGTFPIKPAGDTDAWVRRMQNKTRAFFALQAMKGDDHAQ